MDKSDKESEDFLVSARRYRPRSFKDVIGQEVITTTLVNAIEQNHLAQALLFCGPRGVGKTTCARILARKINTETGNDPNNDFAFNIFELDAASNNSVEDIRYLIEQVQLPPQAGKYKVYIIDEVHMLSQAAFNAFLKTLEEPPKHSIFILATTEKQKIIPTILSRCQIFDFRRISESDIKKHLEYICELQAITAEDQALQIIAQKADGAMRDALSIFDRLVSFSGKILSTKTVTETLFVLDKHTLAHLVDLALDNDIPQLLLAYDHIVKRGFEGRYFLAELASYIRDLMVIKTDPQSKLLGVNNSLVSKYLEQSKKLIPKKLIEALNNICRCELEYKNTLNQRLLVELCLMQLASIKDMESKKTSQKRIIPPSSYSQDGKTPIEKAPNNKKDTAQQPLVESKKRLVSPPEEVSSALSLSSLKKKIITDKKSQSQDSSEVIFNTPFKKEDFEKAWEQLLSKMKENNRKSLSATLRVTKVKLLENSIILIKVPNEVSKAELVEAQVEMIDFLGEWLKNGHIQFRYEVDDTVERERTFTKSEKYLRLKELNPHIDVLRKTFGLD